MAVASLRGEAVELLQGLIRLDTVNPPGNETLAADYLRSYLEEAGLQVELYARVPERANLVARLRGCGTGPRLALLSHTDTVLADPGEWQLDPWSGEVRGDELWGRGALDMKGQVAASAVAIASLAREGFRPNGDLIFVAAADEEVGAGFGLSWVCDTHPEAVRAEYALNEGAGERVVLGERVFYPCALAEKMSRPFRLRVHGRSGHASMPAIADNALVKAAPLIQRLGEYRPRRRYVAETEAFTRAVLGELPPVDEVLERLEAVSPLARELLEPLLAPTFSPTMATASRKRNVIPALCEVVVDCRILPGEDGEAVDRLVHEVLGELEYGHEVIDAQGGTRSPGDTPLWDAVASFLAEVDPGAEPLPYVVPGFTDSHWLRGPFGTVAYGFFPIKTMDAELQARLIHSADERIHLDDLELGTEFLRHAARAIGALDA
ncbi:MAG: M20/M25/M40 family metallo-hydrolase [Thermoleophilia bacterium]|nr:M20/M25/M40 family metallo-hydrolase [Thermoleophilia bacterium]